MDINIKDLTIEKVHNSLLKEEYTIRQLVDSYLAIIKEKNSSINAYLEIFDDIDTQIEKANKMFKDGTSTLMTGIPISIKDNMLFEGHISSASSLILKNHKSIYNSFVVQKLIDNGAIILGRTNMDEFAMGSSTETSAYGITKNPVDESRVPGGSSGGAVASIAMGGALVALGSDTGGSIRQPAAFTGLIGFKPTYGSVSRSGIISMASSLDQVGSFGKTVADVEILFKTISSYDPKDSTSIKDEDRNVSKDLKKKIGIPRQFLNGEGIDKEILKNFEDSCDKLKSLGYELIDISLPAIKYSLAVYYILMPAEVSSNLARYDGIRYGNSHKSNNLLDVYTKSRGEGFGREVRRRILLGTYILSHGYYDAYYNTAIKMRSIIKKELENIFKEVDAIITPTSPYLPFKFNEKIDDPISMYMSDLFTVPANIAEIPAISVPSGKNIGGLPFSLHIMGPFLREDILFKISKDFTGE